MMDESQWVDGWAAAIRGALSRHWYAERLSYRVEPSVYSTSPDGRDWADHPGLAPGTVTVTPAPGAGDPVKDALRRLLAALIGLPPGMGLRHGEAFVRLDRPARDAVAWTPPLKARRVEWKVAEAGRRGVALLAPPASAD